MQSHRDGMEQRTEGASRPWHQEHHSLGELLSATRNRNAREAAQEYETGLREVTRDLREAVEAVGAVTSTDRYSHDRLVEVLDSEEGGLIPKLEALAAFQEEHGLKGAETQLSPMDTQLLLCISRAVVNCSQACQSYRQEYGEQGMLQISLDHQFLTTAESFNLVVKDLYPKAQAALLSSLRQNTVGSPVGVESMAAALRHMRSRSDCLGAACDAFSALLEDEYPELDTTALSQLNSLSPIGRAHIPVDDFLSVYSGLSPSHQAIFRAGLEEFVSSGEELLPPQTTVASEALEKWVNQIGGLLHKIPGH